MNSSLASRLEKTLVVLLVASFALPLTLRGVLYFWGSNSTATVWLRNTTLAGLRVTPQQVAFSRSTLLSAKYQHMVAANYDFNFTGLELMTRLTDELYLRVFDRAPNTYAVGPGGTLWDQTYLEEYFFKRATRQRFEGFVKNLRRMQDACDARGIAFAFVITPSKASIYPEDAPAGWQRRYDPAPRAYDLLVSMLQAAGIRYVDGHRITADLKPTAQVPVFPRGGIHWGDLPALATGNALLKVLAAQGLHVQPIQDYQVRLSNDPVGQAADVALVMNRLTPAHFPVAEVTVQPTAVENPDPPTLVCVGGSFTWSILQMLASSNQFAELENYFYYHRGHRAYSGGELYQVAVEPTPPLNFATDVFAADALVIELNEEMAAKSTSHLDDFMHDALAALPDPHRPKAPFHYTAQVRYHWGDKLSFSEGEQAIDLAALSNFTPLAPGGAFTLGNDAAVRLQVTPIDEEMILEVDANAFLVDTRLPEQRVQVAVNGRALADWTWRSGTPPHHELIIPRGLLAGKQGELRVGFHIARPGSPAEFGVSPDPNKYGLCVTGLCVRSVHRINYQWGDTLSFVAGQGSIDQAALSGFGPPTSAGTPTQGTDATVRLHTPPADGSMVLEADAGAFLVDTRMPEQRVQVTANGRPVGEWVWQAGTPPRHALTVARELLEGGELRLGFHVARPGSPAEFGLSTDNSPYGIFLASLRFHPAPQIEYRWGDQLSFVAGQGSIDPGALSGFTPLTPVGVYTLGSDSVIRLRVPPADKDMALEMNAGAFLVDTRMPEQRVQVTANGKPIADWVWHADTSPHHVVGIPRALLTGGELRLGFHVARPTSPAEFGLGPDNNPYGLLLTTLRILDVTSPAASPSP